MSQSHSGRMRELKRANTRPKADGAVGPVAPGLSEAGQGAGTAGVVPEEDVSSLPQKEAVERLKKALREVGNRDTTLRSMQRNYETLVKAHEEGRAEHARRKVAFDQLSDNFAAQSVKLDERETALRKATKLVEELEGREKRAQMELLRLAEERSSESREHGRRTAAFDALNDKLKEASDLLDAERLRARDLQGRVEKLKGTSEDARKRQEQAEKVGRELAARLTVAEKAGAEVMSLRAELAASSAEAEELRTMAEQQVDLTRRQLGARGKEVEGKDKELQTALQQATKAQRECALLHAELADARQEVEEGKKAASERAVEQAAKAKVQAEEVARLEEGLKASRAGEARLSEEVAKLLTSMKDAEAALLARLDAAREDNFKSLSNLQAEAERATRTEREKAEEALREREATAAAEQARLRKEAEVEAQRLRLAAEQAREGAEAKLKSLESSKDSLLSSLSGEAAAAREALEELQRQREAAVQRMEEAAQEQRVAQQRAEQEAEERRRALEAAVQAGAAEVLSAAAAAKAEAEGKSRAEQKVGALEVEQARLKTELRSTVKRSSAAEGRVKVLEGDVTNLTREAKVQHAKLAELEVALQVARGEMASSEESRKREGDARRAAEEEAACREAAKSAAEARATKAEAGLVQAETDTANARAAEDQGRERVRVMSAEVERVCADALKAQAAAQRAGEDLARSERESALARDAARALEEAMERLGKEAGDKDGTLGRLQQEVQRLTRKGEKDDGELQRLATELGSKTSALSSLDGLGARSKEVLSVIKRLQAASDAMEPAVTCLQCLGPLKQCKTLVPCGHNLCGSCFTEAQAHGGACPECGDEALDHVECEALDQLASKFAFQKTALDALVNIPALAHARS